MDRKIVLNEGPECYADVAPRGPEQTQNRVVGILREHGDGGIVKPDSSFREGNFGDVKIAHKDLNGAPFDMVVVAEIVNPESMSGLFWGKIVEVLGNPDSSDVKIEAVMRQFGLPQDFPDSVKKEIENLETSAATLGWGKFSMLSGILALAYCLIFFILEAFNFFDWQLWLLRAVCSAALTLVLMLAIESVRSK